MAAHDDAIRERASKLRQDAGNQRLVGQERAARQAATIEGLAEARRQVVQERATDRGEREAAVLELCSRFLVWATTNDIPYNSPSMMPGARRNWILGYRVGHPHNKISGFFYHSPFNAELISEVGHRPGPGMSLLMGRSGLVGELPTYIESTGSDSSARYRMRLRDPDLAAYDIGTIEDSIAKFSARHDVEWP